MEHWAFKVFDEEVRVEIREDHSRFEHIGTGMWRVAVGSYLRARRFAAKTKDFDYTAIASAVINQADGQKAVPKAGGNCEKGQSGF